MALLPKHTLNFSTSLHPDCHHSPTLIQATPISHVTIWSPWSLWGLLFLAVLHTDRKQQEEASPNVNLVSPFPFEKSSLHGLPPIAFKILSVASHLPAYDSRPCSHHSPLPPDTPATARCLFPIRVIKPLERKVKNSVISPTKEMSQPTHSPNPRSFHFPKGNRLQLF